MMLSWMSAWLCLLLPLFLLNRTQCYKVDCLGSGNRRPPRCLNELTFSGNVDTW
jgi:hypothetical protein